MIDLRPIAVVEDSDEDFATMSRAVRSIEPPVELVRYRSAEAFLADLTSLTGPEGRPTWLVVLLDLNLPGLSGSALLGYLRADARYACIPVVVVSGSAHQPGVETAYRLGARGYVVKPFGTEVFADAMSKLVDYWRSVMVPPLSPGSSSERRPQ